MFETHDKTLAWYRKLNKIKQAYESDKAYRDTLVLVKPMRNGRFYVVGKYKKKPNIPY